MSRQIVQQQGTATSHGHTQGTGERAAVSQAMATVVSQWPTDAPCPVRDVLDRIGDTWSLLVVVRLAVQPLRFRELLRQVGGVSQRMLTVTLRALERDGLVDRQVLGGSPPGVSYSLSELGLSLVRPIQALAVWALANDGAIRLARKRYDASAEPAAGVTVHRLATPRRVA